MENGQDRGPDRGIRGPRSLMTRSGRLMDCDRGPMARGPWCRGPWDRGHGRDRDRTAEKIAVRPRFIGPWATTTMIRG